MTTFTAYVLIVYVVLVTAGVISSFRRIGVPRQPLTGGQVTVVAVVQVVAGLAMVNAIQHLLVTT